MGLAEFDLIARIRRRTQARADVRLGIGDDAALLKPRPGQLLALSVDTLNAGVHFPFETAAADIGWKAAAVNLSDLAAMGAEPAWCSLSLSLPEADVDWLEAFLDGFLELADDHHLALVGGDTTRGPLSVSVSVFGFVPEAQALRRDGARDGDDIWVTGTLGDAAAGLQLVQGQGDAVALELDLDAHDWLVHRLHRPQPRVAAGLALRGLAHGCIDVSDGLLADLGHVLAASGCGAIIELSALPTLPALAACLRDEARWSLQCTGGDDYELCFTAPAARAAEVEAALRGCAVPACRIGRIQAEPGLRLLRPDGSAWQPQRAGFEHFEESTR